MLLEGVEVVKLSSEGLTPVFNIWISTACALSANASTSIQGNVAITTTTTIVSSVSVQLAQLASIPAIPLPSNISNYDLLSQLAGLMPLLQTSTPGADTAAISATIEENKGLQTTSAARLMRASLGAQGDWTWSYRIWEWFQDQGIGVGVSLNFSSDHFAVWGRAAAVDKGLI
ncbi:hypothetical protein BDZ45DRAFT_807245 [Acephala macrosclerotiorum]|nr:hypothetical protein BDZ45DRAFT_807245 [Acephala macrosclerotiorum]